MIFLNYYYIGSNHVLSHRLEDITVLWFHNFGSLVQRVHNAYPDHSVSDIPWLHDMYHLKWSLHAICLTSPLTLVQSIYKQTIYHYIAA